MNCAGAVDKGKGEGIGCWIGCVGLILLLLFKLVESTTFVWVIDYFYNYGFCIFLLLPTANIFDTWPNKGFGVD